MSGNQGKKSIWKVTPAVIWQRWWKMRQLCFPLSATRSLEWRYWHTMGLFIMGTETSSGRRWVGCWAWRQRRSAAGRRREKLWRNAKGKLPSTPWYDRWHHWISSTDHHSVTWVLIPFSILPSLFRKEASPTRHFLQRTSSLNLVRYKIVAPHILIIKKIDNIKCILSFFSPRNSRIWYSGSFDRLQQCDIRWCCWSETLHPGLSKTSQHWGFPCWFIFGLLIHWFFSLRFVLIARK